MAKKINKKELSDKFTTQVMNEIGLGVGEFGTVIDQDTGQMLQFNGKMLKYNQGDQPPIIHLSDSLLNPIGDLKQMRNLFAYYIRKEEEFPQSERTPGMYFPIQSADEEKSSMILQYMDQDGVLREVHSKEYYNEAICYADLMMQYNGDQNVDLNEYDFPLEAARKKKKL